MKQKRTLLGFRRRRVGYSKISQILSIIVYILGVAPNKPSTIDDTRDSLYAVYTMNAKTESARIEFTPIAICFAFTTTTNFVLS